MLISHTRLQDAPILGLQTGAPLGKITRFIIDPRKFQIIAFYCRGPRVQGEAVLHSSDIREISNVGLIVDGADSLMSPEGLVRLKEITDLHFELLGKPVVTNQKRKLGKVEGYSLDLESFYIMKINVRQPIMRSFMGGNLLIDRTQITEITNSHIVVNDGIVEEKTKHNKKLNPLIDNPFRRSETPQPTASSTKE